MMPRIFSSKQQRLVLSSSSSSSSSPRQILTHAQIPAPSFFAYTTAQSRHRHSPHTPQSPPSNFLSLAALLLHPTSSLLPSSMDNPYSFGRQLGEGVDGVVRILSDSSSGHQFACKSVPSSRPDALLHARTEIAMLQKLRGHPNIISLHNHFEDDEHIHLVLDLCKGGDLCEHVRKKGHLSEREAAQAMVTILRAVSFCHEKGVVHRDLKPDNILFPRRNSSYSELKLADFGASADLSKRGFFTEVEGTAWYMAPEVLSGSYDEKADIWSLGVMLYVMLSGYLPFDGDGTQAIFQSIKRGKLDLKSDPWPAISAEAKDLLKGMLQKSPYRRLRLRDVLVHPWLQNSSAEGFEGWHNLQASESVFVGG